MGCGLKACEPWIRLWARKTQTQMTSLIEKDSPVMQCILVNSYFSIVRSFYSKIKRNQPLFFLTYHELWRAVYVLVNLISPLPKEVLPAWRKCLKSALGCAIWDPVYPSKNVRMYLDSYAFTAILYSFSFEYCFKTHQVTHLSTEINSIMQL